MLLQSAREQYAEQQKITASAILTARRKRTAAQVAAVVVAHQLDAAALAFESTAEQLAEQGLEAAPVAVASLTSVVSRSRDVVPLAEKARSRSTLDRLVSALVMDASRTAATVDLGRRPALTGYIRSLNGPSCPRCAILAGRVYRYSTGFRRHPGCDCLMTPTTLDRGRSLVTDPMAALRDGQVRGLSKADTEAVLEHGADFGKVVNIRRREAGLTVGSSVFARAGKLTPQGILHVASDRADAVRLLTKHGYIAA